MDYSRNYSYDNGSLISEGRVWVDGLKMDIVPIGLELGGYGDNYTLDRQVITEPIKLADNSRRDGIAYLNIILPNRSPAPFPDGSLPDLNADLTKDPFAWGVVTQTGTGFHIGNGYFVTAKHVVDGATKYKNYQYGLAYCGIGGDSSAGAVNVAAYSTIDGVWSFPGADLAVIHLSSVPASLSSWSYASAIGHQKTVFSNSVLQTLSDPDQKYSIYGYGIPYGRYAMYDLNKDIWRPGSLKANIGSSIIDVPTLSGTRQGSEDLADGDLSSYEYYTYSGLPAFYLHNLEVANGDSGGPVIGADGKVYGITVAMEDSSTLSGAEILMFDYEQLRWIQSITQPLSHSGGLDDPSSNPSLLRILKLDDVLDQVSDEANDLLACYNVMRTFVDSDKEYTYANHSSIPKPANSSGTTVYEFVTKSNFQPNAPSPRPPFMADFRLPAEALASTYLRVNPISGDVYDFTYNPLTGRGVELIDANQNGLIDTLRFHMEDGGADDQDGLENDQIINYGIVATRAPVSPVYVFSRNGNSFYTLNDALRDRIVRKSYAPGVVQDVINLNPDSIAPIASGLGYQYRGQSYCYDVPDAQNSTLFRFRSIADGYPFYIKDPSEAFNLIDMDLYKNIHVTSGLDLSNGKGYDNGKGYETVLTSGSYRYEGEVIPLSPSDFGRPNKPAGGTPVKKPKKRNVRKTDSNAKSDMFRRSFFEAQDMLDRETMMANGFAGSPYPGTLDPLGVLALPKTSLNLTSLSDS